MSLFLDDEILVLLNEFCDTTDDLNFEECSGVLENKNGKLYDQMYTVMKNKIYNILLIPHKS